MATPPNIAVSWTAGAYYPPGTIKPLDSEAVRNAVHCPVGHTEREIAGYQLVNEGVPHLRTWGLLGFFLSNGIVNDTEINDLYGVPLLAGEQVVYRGNVYCGTRAADGAFTRHQFGQFTVTITPTGEDNEDPLVKATLHDHYTIRAMITALRAEVAALRKYAAEHNHMHANTPETNAIAAVRALVNANTAADNALATRVEALEDGDDPPPGGGTGG